MTSKTIITREQQKINASQKEIARDEQKTDWEENNERIAAELNNWRRLRWESGKRVISEKKSVIEETWFKKTMIKEREKISSKRALAREQLEERCIRDSQNKRALASNCWKEDCGRDKYNRRDA